MLLTMCMGSLDPSTEKSNGGAFTLNLLVRIARSRWTKISQMVQL